MTTTVTVPDHWAPHADPDAIESRRAHWDHLAEGLRPNRSGELARGMSGCLHDAAVLLRSAQEQLDYVWDAAAAAGHRGAIGPGRVDRPAQPGQRGDGGESGESGQGDPQAGQ